MRRLSGGGETVVVGRGVVSRLAELLPRREGRRRAAVVSQPSVRPVARRVADALRRSGLAAEVIAAPDAEAAKSLSAVEDLYRAFNRLRLTREDTVVVVGGGAITDAGGFAAATYLRGVEAVYVPTTLLGAVDAAVGGKTGVDVEGKNLAGVFAHPGLVAVDLDVLAGLPAPLVRQGSAEAYKVGLAVDPALAELYEHHGIDAPLEEVVIRAVSAKLEVIDSDFREHGRRAVLNLGHTVGHAVEVLGGLAHGEAVSVGLVAAVVVSREVLGFGEVERVVETLRRLGLPVRAPAGIGRRDVERLVALDKKRGPDAWRMVLLRAVGDARLVEVQPEVVGSGLDAVGIGATP